MTTIVVFAHVIKIAELPYFRLEPDDNFKNVMEDYFSSVWLTVITMTSVGYGDIPPATTIGRVLCIVLAIWGSFLVSLLVVQLKSVFNLPQNELMAMREI